MEDKKKTEFYQILAVTSIFCLVVVSLLYFQIWEESRMQNQYQVGINDGWNNATNSMNDFVTNSLYMYGFVAWKIPVITNGTVTNQTMTIKLVPQSGQ